MQDLLRTCINCDWSSILNLDMNNMQQLINIFYVYSFILVILHQNT
jgi:hypothetical protein